jgi:hypothetical protein
MPGGRRSRARIRVWEDDPLSGGPLISRPVPALAHAILPIAIGGEAPPARVHARGTPAFRYWVAAEALARGLAFWGEIVPEETRWRAGATLPVSLDYAEALNAYYAREEDAARRWGAGLSFYHAPFAGGTMYTAESADLCCHELGHAVLDALKPDLFHVMSAEIAAFHEAFGDISAILSALQLPSVRKGVLEQTGGRLYQTSRLSRVGEQLGAAIRAERPDAVDPTSLRDAVNSFFYQDPITLPPTRPANVLSSGPHSFSRVFSGAVFEALAGMLVLHADGRAPTEEDLVTVAEELGELLVLAVLAAPVVAEFYSQVAALMLHADATRFAGKYHRALAGAFMRHGVLGLDGPQIVSDAVASGTALPPTPVTPVGVAGAAGGPAGAPVAGGGGLAEVPLPAALVGLSRPCRAFAPAAPKRFPVTSASSEVVGADPVAPERAARMFAGELFQRGRVDVGAYGHPERSIESVLAGKTHAVVEQNGALVLVRRVFECGSCAAGLQLGHGAN